MKFLLGFFSLRWMRVFDFLAPVAIRILLAPIFWVLGIKHLGLGSSPDFAFANPLSWVDPAVVQANAAALDIPLFSGLGAETLVWIVGGIEIAGAVLLILGLAVRWITLALLAVTTLLTYLSLQGEPVVASLSKLVAEHGFVTMVDSSLEVYVTYLILLLALFFMGAGRWFSMDWFIYRNFMRKIDDNDARHREDPFEVDATDEPGIARRV